MRFVDARQVEGERFEDLFKCTSVGAPEGGREAWAAVVARSRHAVACLANDEDVLAGYYLLSPSSALLREEGRVAFALLDLYMHPMYRGRGFGRDACEHACKRVAGLGIPELICRIPSKDDSCARFLTSCGFVRYPLHSRLSRSKRHCIYGRELTIPQGVSPESRMREEMIELSAALRRWEEDHSTASKELVSHQCFLVGSLLVDYRQVEENAGIRLLDGDIVRTADEQMESVRAEIDA